MECILIRHGMTRGNQLKQYIGQFVDEPLIEEGSNQLLERKELGIYPEADMLYVSPMKRCVQTAKLLYPNLEMHTVYNFQECDFGTFEGKTYEELKDLPEYQEWLKGNGMTTFPEGEDPKEFIQRCVDAFVNTLKQLSVECGIMNDPNSKIAFVIHGGTIMAIMSMLAPDRLNYFDYQVGNGCGYICKLSEESDEIQFSEYRKL